MAPRVSVIVPFRNGLREIPGLVEALAAQTLPAGEFEVIWVDDASNDGGGEQLRAELRPGWRLVRHTQSRGSYAARNTGLRASVGGVLAFTDVDCRPAADWLAAGLQAVTMAPRVAGRIEFIVSQPPTAAELVDARRFFRQRRYVQEGFAATANLFVRREVFDAVGGFDERLRYGGDYEFGRRCAAAGIPIVYSEHAVIRHAARATLPELLRKAVRVGYGAGQVCRLGRMPLRVLADRVLDRVALAVRRGGRDAVNTPEPDAPGPPRSASTTAVLGLLMLATTMGMARGLISSVPRAPRRTGEGTP